MVGMIIFLSVCVVYCCIFPFLMKWADKKDAENRAKFDAKNDEYMKCVFENATDKQLEIFHKIMSAPPRKRERRYGSMSGTIYSNRKRMCKRPWRMM